MTRTDRTSSWRSCANTEELGIQLIDVPTETSGDGGRRAAEILLERGVLPDGVLCHSDTVAMGFCRALQDAGKPGQVRVVGYDNIEMAELWIPALTTVATGPLELGRRAATAILGGIDSGTTAVEPYLATPTLCSCWESAQIGALAIEDSPTGSASALAAGLPVLVVPPEIPVPPVPGMVQLATLEGLSVLKLPGLRQAALGSPG